jgi:hypothetical protein
MLEIVHRQKPKFRMSRITADLDSYLNSFGSRTVNLLLRGRLLPERVRYSKWANPHRAITKRRFDSPVVIFPHGKYGIYIKFYLK